MNYSKIYESIIQKSKYEHHVRKELKESQNLYFEIHHIIPRSSGGTDEEDNLCLLYAREHYLCHWLLYKINPSKENAFSWWMMSNGGNAFHTDRKKQTSRKYEYARSAFAKSIGDIHRGKSLSVSQREKLSSSKRGAKNPMFGRKLSEERRKYFSDVNSGEKNKFYGKTHTEDVRRRISEARSKIKGDLHPNFGRKDMFSEEVKLRFSEMYKGKPRKIAHEIVACPHCGKEGIKPNMVRWHFDNCKERLRESVDRFS